MDRSDDHQSEGRPPVDVNTGLREPHREIQVHRKGAREKAVVMVLSGWSIDRIARHKDIRAKPETVRRWLHEPKTRALIDQKLAEMRDYASRRLRAHADEMINVVIGIARGEGGDEKASDRLRAACAALDRIGIEANQKTTQEVNVNVNVTETTEELLAEAKRLTAAIEAEVEVIERGDDEKKTA